MSTFDAYLNEKLKDPAFKAEYDALEPEFSMIQAMIDARKASDLSQPQHSEGTEYLSQDNLAEVRSLFGVIPSGMSLEEANEDRRSLI